MTWKLMKYDLKRMTVLVKWFYPIALVLAVIIRLINLVEGVQIVTIINGVMQGIFYGVLVNILVNTVIHIIRNVVLYFFKDQSYLTHTLPVSKKQLFISKYLSAILFMFVSLIDIIASLLIVFCSPELIQALKVVITSSVANFNMSVGVFLFLIISIIVFQALSITSIGLTAMIKGYFYNRKKALKSVLFFLMFYGIVNAVIFVLGLFVSLICGNVAGLFASQIPQDIFIGILITCLTANVGSSVFFFFYGQKVFEKGVNVD